MTTTPRRARFQIHLSTAIVLMFVAGGLMWLNMSARHERRSGIEDVHTPEEHAEAARHGMLLHAYRGVERNIDHFGWPYEALTIGENTPSAISWKYIFYDTIAVVYVLFSVWFFCELWIRERAARKGV